MTIQAQLPGGLTLEFPDGTPDAIVQGAVKQQLSQQPDGASQTPESKLGLTPAPPEEKAPTEDTGTFSPEGVYVPAGTVPAQGAHPIASITDLRDRIQQGDLDALKWLAPPASAPDAGSVPPVTDTTGGPVISPDAVSRSARYAAMVGVHGLATLAQMPINALLGLEQGPSGALTINPATNTLGLTPEAMTTAQVLTPGGGIAGGRDVQFSGANAFKREPPSTLEQAGVMKPAPVTMDELRGAMSRVPPEEYGPPSPPVNQFMPGEPQPAPSPDQQGTPQPGPTAAGAQITPAAELGMTPAEEAAYRSTAEGNKLLEPQEPGIRDEKQYLTGERINEAEASQDVETARNLNSLREQTPQLDKEMTADENFNNNLRYNAINKALPGRVQIQAAEAARTEAMQENEPKVFGGPNVTDADVQPIAKDIQDILNDPKNRQNTQLGQYVRPLIDRLMNPDGTPKITDPRELWGWRQDVQHLTSKAAQMGDPNLSRVSGILGKVLDTTDDQLEAAAPGYKAQLRDDYRTRSREIDAMTALNDERFKLFDSQNKPNYNALQSLMRRMVDARQEADPYEPFTHVQQDTLDQLWNVRDSMRRSQAVARLGKPKGSPTSQNIGDALRIAGRMAVKSAAPAIGLTLGSAIPIPYIGPALGLTAGTVVNHLLSERAMVQRLGEGRALMQPNRLGPSSAP
jgi:hypothetical protein